MGEMDRLCGVLRSGYRIGDYDKPIVEFLLKSQCFYVYVSMLLLQRYCSHSCIYLCTRVDALVKFSERTWGSTSVGYEWIIIYKNMYIE